jgi:hypothetical protein
LPRQSFWLPEDGSIISAQRAASNTDRAARHLRKYLARLFWRLEAGRFLVVSFLCDRRNALLYDRDRTLNLLVRNSARGARFFNVSMRSSRVFHQTLAISYQTSSALLLGGLRRSVRRFGFEAFRYLIHGAQGLNHKRLAFFVVDDVDRRPDETKRQEGVIPKQEMQAAIRYLIEAIVGCVERAIPEARSLFDMRIHRLRFIKEV